jgi:Smg protein
MMFDILLYLYDTYLYADRIPDADQLSRKLSAAGFEDEAIGEALDWLAALDDLAPAVDADRPPSMRIYAEQEANRLASDGRGFLAYLESSGLLPAHAREWIIDRALALPDSHVSAKRIKWIALLALWKLKGAGEVLWLEDLVRGEEETGEDGWKPTLH